ncbi:hypothetical protein Tco_0553507 [Tanacetum coccineum]
MGKLTSARNDEMGQMEQNGTLTIWGYVAHLYEFKARMHASLYMVQELGDHVKLERWQGMVRARAARSDKDGLLGLQGEEVAFFLVPKVMTRLGVTRM